MWIPSATSSSKVFSFPPLLFHMFLILLTTSLLLLCIGGYLGVRLYHESAELTEQNSYLRQKEKDLDALGQAMEQIQDDEMIIRSFLGLDSRGGTDVGFGQGGEPSPDLSTIAPNAAGATSTIPLPREFHPYSIVERAQILREDLKELVEAMRDQRQILDSTPSIVPLSTERYWISSGFGWRRSPFTGIKEFHNGLDICSRKGTAIIAPADGTVFKKGKHRYLGKYIRIDHGRTITTTYGHLSGFNVSLGQKVRRGDVIAFMGNTGRSAGTHLHYTLRVKKKCVNPLHYMLNTKRNRLVAVRAKNRVGGP